MKFYTVENLKISYAIPSDGIDMLTMGKAFKVLDKKSENKSLDSIADFNFVFLENPYKFASEENLAFKHEEKKLTFALVSPNTIFQVKDSEQTYFCAIHEGYLKANPNKQSLEDILKLQSVAVTDPIEIKALDWLDNGRVGASSATMCAALFPNLKNHYKLRDKYDYDEKLEINWPHDNDDFGRCMKFLEAVPEARARLDELKPLSKEWDGLVNNWEKIETFTKANNTDDAYALIRESLGQPKKMKP